MSESFSVSGILFVKVSLIQFVNSGKQQNFLEFL